MDLSKQYDDFADKFSKFAFGDKGNDPSVNSSVSKKAFYERLDFLRPGLKVLDLACGDGADMLVYKDLGAEIYGADASKEMIDLARVKIPEANFILSEMSETSFEDNFFDVVLSKYAIQTSQDILPVYKEIHRVLKRGGTMMILVTHPFRHFFERKDLYADYFEQTIVNSNVFQGQMTFREPTHTMNEYLSDFLFEKFDVKKYYEQYDPSCEQVYGGKYPGFFILKAVKR